jgi:hypothetical protein
MAIVLNINADAAVVFANQLEKLHRSALPSAIRNTLNEAAMLVKKDTLLKSAKDNFKERQANFFKANSKVDFAKGFNVNTMQATVGMYSNKLKGEDNYAVKDLEQQEHGGQIEGRSFIAQKAARVSGWKMPKKKYSISDITKGKTKIYDSEKNEAKTKKQQWIRTSVHAGVGSIVMGNYRDGKRRFGYEITEINNSNGLKIKHKRIFSIVADREVKIKATHFMKEASIPVARKMENIFQEKAKFQIQKYTR